MVIKRKMYKNCECNDNCVKQGKNKWNFSIKYRLRNNCIKQCGSECELLIKQKLRNNSVNQGKSQCKIASNDLCDKSEKNDFILSPRDHPYLCNVCSKRFSRMCAFKKHSLMHLEKSSQSSKISNSKLKQKIHSEKKCIIYVKKLRICEYSSGMTEINCIKDYDVIHWRGTSYVCRFCSKGFALKCNFVIHSLTHEKENHICGIYNEKFLQNSNLEAQFIIHKNPLLSDTNDKYDLRACQPSGKKINSIDLHKKILKNNWNFNAHNNLKDQRSHVCEFCMKRFQSKSSLKAHYSIRHAHKREKSYICEICEKAVLSKHTLQQHYRTHTSEKPYVCEICMRGFALKTNLNAHYRTHTNEKPYICEICERGFTEKKQLKNHYLIHTNEKPHVCDICTKSCNRKDNLKSHYRIHTNEKPFMCDICKTSYSHRSGLKSHLLVHESEKSHICEICKKKFRHKSTLFQHYCFIHGKLKPHVCELCNKRFASRSHLKRHYLSHTNEKPHACDICPKKYKDKTNLRKHSTTHL